MRLLMELVRGTKLLAITQQVSIESEVAHKRAVSNPHLTWQNTAPEPTCAGDSCEGWCSCMAGQPSRWRLFASVGLLAWAAGLQLHMWHIQRTPEFKEKFGGAGEQAAEQQAPKPQVSVRLRSGSGVWS